MKAILAEHKLRTGRSDGLVFGRDPATPFDPRALVRRAATAWRRAGVGETYSPHEFRHGAASIMIGAGVNAKAIQTYMGHSSVTVTFDIYGHLFPGAEDEAGDLVDAYLDRTHASTHTATG